MQGHTCKEGPSCLSLGEVLGRYHWIGGNARVKERIQGERVGVRKVMGKQEWNSAE